MSAFTFSINTDRSVEGMTLDELTMGVALLDAIKERAEARALNLPHLIAAHHDALIAALDTRMRNDLQRQLEVEEANLEALRTTAEKRRASENRVTALRKKLGITDSADTTPSGK